MSISHLLRVMLFVCACERERVSEYVVRTSSVVVQNRNSAVQASEQRSVGDGKSDRFAATARRWWRPSGILQRTVVRAKLAV